MRDGLEIIPVRGIGEVTVGTDLAAAIVHAAPWLRDGDILVVTSKIISKAEGRLVDVPASGPEREEVRERIIAAESAGTVARRGQTHIVRTHHGFVMASAGVDASNVEPSRLVLLPKDPDASARSLRAALRERFGLTVGVIISDTMGRPWRNGLTDVALGVAGLPPIRDYRGQFDPYGNELRITQMAIADEIAGAADLVKGKHDQVPVAVVRGYGLDGELPADDGPGGAALVRDPAQDLFTLGTAEARAQGLRDAAQLADAPFFADAPVSKGVVERALAPGFTLEEAGPGLPPHTAYVIRCAVANTGDTGALLQLGVHIHRIRCALAAEGLATMWLAPDRIAVGAAAS